MSQNLTRVIVTTDMEVDDMNSLVHLALYLNLLDVQAVVYTASQYHFSWGWGSYARRGESALADQRASLL